MVRRANMSRHSKFKWKQYLEYNRPDIKIKSFETWCYNNRPKGQIFDTKQELLEAISLYDNNSKFKWRVYLKENRTDIFEKIKTFETWCNKNRPKKTIFNTEQELLEELQLYDNRRKQSQFDWQQYLEYNRPDINIHRFENWCANNRQKKRIFDTEQELLEALQLYDNIQNKNSDFKWRQYLKDNRQDINIRSFDSWCDKNRPKRCVFNTKQELLAAISMYELWYNLCDKYIVRKTKYQGIYNLTEKETGLKFNFYKLGDMLGLI